MNKALLVAVLAGCTAVVSSQPRADYPAAPVPFTDVHLADSFWAPRLERNRTVTIPHNLAQLIESRRVENFERAAVAMASGQEGQFCSVFPFDDSDVFKAIEAASYALAIKPDPALDRQIDQLIAKVAKSQEPDGYLYTVRTIGGPPPQPWVGKQRWSYLYLSHELYNVGHLYEAAVAHYQATGKRSLLDIAIKNADLVVKEFGPGKRTNPPGHQEIEIGLVKLYRVTGNTAYLDLAKFFIDARGRAEGRVPFELDGKTQLLYGEYAQDHKPFVEQTEAVGHAVRAGYLYAGAADVAALRQDKAYLAALERIWRDVVGKKLYITGGIGAAGAWEGYGPAYRLPNASAYAETCANIATFLWNSRMQRLALDAKYADVMERILYNGVLSGLSLSGDRFFYPNPLASFGQHQRTPWFTCACCPPNVARVLTSVPGYFYAASHDSVYVNLFAEGRATMSARGTKLELRQKTEYPWQGDILIEVVPERPVGFRLHVRIPGWARNQPVPSDLYRYLEPPAGAPVVRVNGAEVRPPVEKGYAVIDRTWKAGDKVELSLPMPIRRVVAHEAVEADRGRVAIERGPLVYCAEGPDNGGRAANLVLRDGAALTAEKRPDLLGGVVAIKGVAEALVEKEGRVASESKTMTLIPYYAWANRGATEMAVWLARDPSRARVAREPGLSAKAKVTASPKAAYPQRVNDQYEPESSDDGTGYMHWSPQKGNLAWVEYAFDAPVTVSESSVYWFDDTGGGSVRVPASWRLLYKDGQQWKPVVLNEQPGVAKDRWNKVTFAPLTTSALRLEIQAQKDWSVGVHEWSVR